MQFSSGPLCRLFEGITDLLHRFVFPEAGEVFQCGQRTAVHAVYINSSVQVVYFMLKDAGVPSGGLDYAGCPFFVQAFHAYGARTRHESAEAGKTKASFEELNWRAGCGDDLGIDDDMEGNRFSFALEELFGGDSFGILTAIFDHGELQ